MRGRCCCICNLELVLVSLVVLAAVSAAFTKVESAFTPAAVETGGASAATCDAPSSA